MIKITEKEFKSKFLQLFKMKKADDILTLAFYDEENNIYFCITDLYTMDNVYCKVEPT